MKSSKNAFTQGSGHQAREQGTFAGTSDFHMPISAHGLSHLDAFFNTPSVMFPSLLSTIGLNETKRVESDAAQILTSISSSSYVNKGWSSVVPAVPVIKRPVGRPRIHPKKEVDPNRVKRGDKNTVSFRM